MFCPKVLCGTPLVIANKGNEYRNFVCDSLFVANCDNLFKMQVFCEEINCYFLTITKENVNKNFKNQTKQVTKKLNKETEKLKDRIVKYFKKKVKITS